MAAMTVTESDAGRAPKSIIPSMPKLSLITSFFSSTATSTSEKELELEDTTRFDSAAAGMSTASQSIPASIPAMPSPTDSADPRILFKAASRQESIAATSESDTSRRKKQPPRPKTAFSICHPPPKAGSKRQLRVRAKPLLQLHKLESHSRPTPAYQVLPSSIFSPRLTKAVNRISGVKYSLSPTDVAIVKAEEYSGSGDATAMTEHDKELDVLAIICGGVRKDSQSRSANVKIVFKDGTEWEGLRLPNGSYECFTTDEHGLTRTARWVHRKASSRPGGSNTQLDQNNTGSTSTKKFKFSTISPGSRRHPVIANLSSTNIDIFDSYTIPPANTSPTTESASFQEQTSEVLTTSLELNHLITASAVWVALCEARPLSLLKDTLDGRSYSFKSLSTSQSFTMTSPTPSPQKHKASSAETGTPDMKSGRNLSFKHTFQRAPSLLRRQIAGSRATSSSTKLATTNATNLPQADGTSSSVPLRSRPRADTTSTVLIHENAAQWQPDFDNGMHEADYEDDEANDELEIEGRSAQAGQPVAQPNGLPTEQTLAPDCSASDYDVGGSVPKPRSGNGKAERQGKDKKRNVLSKLLCGVV